MRARAYSSSAACLPELQGNATDATHRSSKVIGLISYPPSPAISTTISRITISDMNVYILP